MRLVLIGLLGVCVLPDSAYSQSLRAEFTYSVTDEPDLFRGFGPSLVFRNRSIEIQIRSVSSTLSRTGTTCAGLIPPDVDCAEEVLDVESTFSSVRIRWALDSRPRAIVGHFGVGMGLGMLEGTRYGTRTGRRLEAGLWVTGVELSTAFSISPATNSRFRIRVSGDGALWLAPVKATCDDCYDPYGGFGELSGGVGVEYRF